MRERLDVGADARALAALVRARPLSTLGLGLAAGVVVGLGQGLVWAGRAPPRPAPPADQRASRLQPVLAAVAVGLVRRVIRAAIAEQVWPGRAAGRG